MYFLFVIFIIDALKRNVNRISQVYRLNEKWKINNLFLKMEEVFDMTSFFLFEDRKITLKNNGEYFGFLQDMDYQIGEKLFEFIKFDDKKIEQLEKLYSELIHAIVERKFHNKEDDLYIKISEIVFKCLQFSPYTHFYNQLLIDTLIKTYNMNFIRSDIVIKSGINLPFNEEFNDEENEIHDVWLEKEEEKMNIRLMLNFCMSKVQDISEERNNKFLDFFEAVKNALIKDFLKKQEEAKERISIMGKYSNEKAIRDLTPEQKMYLYELKSVFDLNNYINISPANTVFLDTMFKVKYTVDEKLDDEESKTHIIDLAKKIQDKDIKVKEVYELSSCEEQIRFELLKVIQNNFIIKKCSNCGEFFIPDKTDQIYCTNLYKDTEKTCKEVGALNKRKEKVQNNAILGEYQREYKRMYGLHYNHAKEFKEKKFKEWSVKARELKKQYKDDELEEFKVELKKLSEEYWKRR